MGFNQFVYNSTIKIFCENNCVRALVGNWVLEAVGSETEL